MQEDLDAPARKCSHNLAHDLVGQADPEHPARADVAWRKAAVGEHDCSGEHGVSRTVVREAISKLQASGLVETRHGIGTFVLERALPNTSLRLNVDTARSILELRMGLETQAAALAATRRSDQQVAQMREALDDYQRLLANNDSCVEGSALPPADAEATGNVCFTEIMQHLGNAMIPRTRVNAAERGAVILMCSANWPTSSMRHSQRHQAPGPGRGAGSDVAAFDQQSRPVFCQLISQIADQARAA